MLALATYAAANPAPAARRVDDGLRFRDVRHAMQWYFESRERISSPSGVRPRTERARDGSHVVVNVDGNRAANLDDVMATLATLNAAVERCGRHCARGMPMLAMMVQGQSQAAIASESGLSQQTVSNEIGRAISFLAGSLGEELLR